MTVIGSIFKNLGGQWNFNRVISSKLPSSPSGTVIGLAEFTNTTKDNQYFYSEFGKFNMNTGGTALDISRYYFYEYDQSSDSIQVYFATNESIRDKFFHMISFENNFITAIGTHLCEQDYYTANYTFPNQGSNTFSIQFKVNGPQKDYIASTVFTKV